jgi:5-oxoprolinase (ATP-hydrolysing) subunit A
VAVSARSICVHGDSPGAVAMAVAVRKALAEAGVEIRPFAP